MSNKENPELAAQSEIESTSADHSADPVRAPDKSLYERGILMTTLQYSMIDRATGGLINRQFLIPTSLPVLPELEGFYADTLSLAPTFRGQIGPSGNGNFALLNRDNRIVGFLCLNMRDLSDRDLAWINCLLAEAEDARLGLASEPVTPQGSEMAVP